MKDRRDGFTLLEILVALAVFGLLTAMLSAGMQFTLAASQRRDRIVADMAELETADRLIRHLVEAADPGTEENPAVFRGTPGSVTLRTALPLAAGGEVARRVVAAIGVDQDHRLILRWAPYLHGQSIGAPPPAQTAALVTGVERLELRYWVRPKPPHPGGWTANSIMREPPALISLRLVFLDGTHRSWPEIVAGPRQERAAE